MPAVPRLTSIGLVVLFGLFAAACSPSRQVREWTPADHGQEQPAQPQNAPPPVADQRPAVAGSAVLALYRMSCASCHGAEGAGDGPNKPADVRLADFRDPAWQAARTDEALATAIRAGTSPDHAFGQRLGEAGVTALVHKVRAFAQ